MGCSDLGVGSSWDWDWDFAIEATRHRAADNATRKSGQHERIRMKNRESASRNGPCSQITACQSFVVDSWFIFRARWKIVASPGLSIFTSPPSLRITSCTANSTKTPYHALLTHSHTHQVSFPTFPLLQHYPHSSIPDCEPTRKHTNLVTVTLVIPWYPLLKASLPAEGELTVHLHLVGLSPNTIARSRADDPNFTTI